MKLRAVVWLLLLGCLGGAALGQFTTVSGTVTDPNGLPYSYGTIASTIVATGTPKFSSNSQVYIQPTQATGLDINGKFLVQLADNTQLTPGSSTWTFTVCSGTGTVLPSFGLGPVCFTVTGVTVSGSSQDIGATLRAAAPALTVNFSGGGAVTGTGTNRTMPIWTGTTSLGNSPLILEASFPIIDNGDQFNMTGTGLAAQTGLAQPAINVGATLGSASTACNATNWSLTANPFPGCSGVFISTGPAHSGGTMGYVASTVANLSFGSGTPPLPNVGVGLVGSATIGALSSNNMGDVRGVYGLGTNAGSGTLTSLTGVYGQATNFSGGSSPTNMRALYAINAFQASATNSYGLYVDTPNIQNALTITHNYGIFVADQTAAGSGTNSDPHGIYVQGGGIQTAAHTFSTLPACAAGLEGRMEAVTDSTTATWGATITGSSTNHVLAYCDGTNWTVAAK